ncbi:MAG: NlpC/P60 family protein [Armatimonadota bacterium]
MTSPLLRYARILVLLVTATFATQVRADSVASVRVSTAKLRSAPAESRRAITLLDRGDKARVVGRRSGWVRVETSSGVRGWIRADLVRVLEGRAPVKSSVRTASAKRPSRSKKPVATRNASSVKSMVVARSASKPHSAKVRTTQSPVRVAESSKRSSTPQVAGVPEAALPVDKETRPTTDETSSAPERIEVESDDQILIALPEAEVALESEDRIARARASLIDDAMSVYRVENEPVRSTTRRTALVSRAKSLRGTPYRFGATGRGSFDCSGFTQHLYRRQGVSIPRTASEQFHFGTPVGRMSLRQGDLVFFRNTGGRRGISHVGMFLGNGRFIHASSRGRGVRIDGLSEAYYSAHFSGARRMLK